MISIFDGRYRDLTNFTSDEYLHFNSCGISYMRYTEKPRTTRFYRPDGRVDCHFLLVTSGSLIAEIDGKEYHLKVGDGLFYRPNDTQCYTVSVDENQPYEEHFYAHFCGTVADEVLKKAGFDRSMPIFNTTGEVKRIFEALIRCYRRGDEMTAIGNLLRLVALLSPKSLANPNVGSKLILSEAEFISSHYSEEIDLDKCAERCGFSRSRFTHLFTEVVGISPYRYQQKFRLEQACELLRSTSLPVSEVAENVGFQDALYFSRLFKKRFGMSPSDMRK